MEKFFYSIFFCFFLIEVSCSSHENLKKNGFLYEKKAENNCTECRKFRRENTVLNNRLLEMLEKEKISKKNLNNDSLGIKKFENSLNEINIIKEKIHIYYEKTLSQSFILPMNRSCISDFGSTESMIYNKPENFELNASFDSLFRSENNENKEQELSEENQRLKDQIEFVKEGLLKHEKYIKVQDEQLFEYKNVIEDCEKKLCTENENRNELLNENKSLYEENEMLRNNNSDLEKQKNILLKELKKISEKEFVTSLTQTDDHKIEKKIFSFFIYKVLDYFIAPTEQKSERYPSPVKSADEENYHSNNLSFELEGLQSSELEFQSPMNNMVKENGLSYQERTSLRNPCNCLPTSKPRVNGFYEEKIEEKMLDKPTQTEEEKKISEEGIQTYKEAIEKKMSEKNTQIEEEKKFGDSFIVSIIKRNKKLFLFLGCILSIPTLFYLNKEKVGYSYRFLK